ncbi:delphilin-like [Dorcoceras hygrometricum]|uniref:Delphilin-like n=1 Tax=Dorcoceras hygrometricum TaxID=472368 RepID=A0A2Z7AM52_9LAMI|nr:delphilin-like [Dorcoceras hygrometricum]
MSSTFIANFYQVNFDSVLLISDHDGMLNMFKALETSGLRGFLGCESVVYEKELEQFFDTALVQDGDITGAVSGKFFSVSQARFAEIFELPTQGLVDFSDVPTNLVFDARSIFSKSVEQVDIHGKKRFMKHEYRLLNDILAKAITVKAGSFDAITNERFMMMTAIHFGLKVNWSKVLFSVLKDMVDRKQKKAKGYAAQIGVLLKSIPAITMGEGVSFPISKILSIKTVNTYIAMNHTIDARSQSDEPGVADVAVVKRKSKSKKKSETTDETPVENISEVVGSKKRPAAEDSAPVIPKKRRTVKGKASLYVVPVAQDVVPLQIIEPTPAATVVKSPAPKSISRKRRLVLPTGSDDEIMDTQEPVKDTNEIAEKHTDEIDDIISQITAETLKMGSDEKEQEEQRSPESPPPTFQRQDTSASSSDSPMHFNSDDIPLDDTADVQPTFPAVTVDLSPLLDDLKISLSKRMDDAQSDILSRLHTVERGLRDTLGQQNEYFRNLFQSAQQDGKNQDDIQTLRFNPLKKVVLAQGVTAGADSVEVKKEIKALYAKINSLDGQVAAIRNEQLEFQTKIAEYILSLSTQIGYLVNYIRGGDPKKGEGSSSRRPLSPPVNQGEGSGGDTVRTTEIAHRDIDNTQRNILEILMAADRQRERERGSVTPEPTGITNWGK